MNRLLALVLFALACQSPSATPIYTPAETTLAFSNGSVQLRGTLWTPSGGEAATTGAGIFGTDLEHEDATVPSAGIAVEYKTFFTTV